jgi:protein-arginine kinase activator protein McsA
MEADESNKILHLSKLRSSLAEAIENEDYEKAAILRDKIKEIEEKEDH